MLRKVKANYSDSNKFLDKFNLRNSTNDLSQPRSRHMGKRKRQQILLGENRNPNKQIMDRALVSSVKFITSINKREKKRESKISPELSKVLSANTVSSTSTGYSIPDKSKRREYQGNKVYQKQKGGKHSKDVLKQSLKSQMTKKWRTFGLYNESILSSFKELSLQLIDNEVDDDCDTDDDVCDNGITYCQSKLEAALSSALLKQNKSYSRGN